jgi:sialic acid synthase SpsE
MDEVNLTAMQNISKEFGVKIGYSDHTMGIEIAIAAAALGASVIEKHFTLDKNMVGFDHKISLEPDELWSMVRNIRAINAIKGDGIKKISTQEMVTRNKYHVSMTSARKISAGEVLDMSMVEYKNPGTGIPHKNASMVFGKRAKVDIKENTLISIDMFEI